MSINRLLIVILAALFALPLLNAFTLNYYEVIRLAIILAGLLFLYFRELKPFIRSFCEKPQDERNPQVQTRILFLTLLCFVFIIIQFDPLNREGGIIRGSYWFLSFFLLTLVGYWLAVYGERSFFLKRASTNEEIYSKNEKNVVLIVASVLAVFILVNFLSSDAPLVGWFRLLSLIQVVLLYFFTRDIFFSGGASNKLGRISISKVWKTTLGVFALVIMLNSFQGMRLFNRFQQINQLVEAGFVDLAFQEIRGLIEGNSHLQIPAFTEESMLTRLSSGKENTAESLYLAAMLYIQKEEWVAATDLFFEIGEQNTPEAYRLKRNKNYYMNASMVALKLLNWPLLEAICHEALERFPEEPRLLSQYVLALVKRRKPQSFDCVSQLIATEGTEFEGKLAEGEKRFISVEKVIPESWRSVWGFLHLGDLAWLSSQAGFRLLHPDEEIGSTGVRIPVSIQAVSAGYEFSKGRLSIDGEKHYTGSRGYNIGVLDPETGDMEEWVNFDTYGDGSQNGKMATFISEIPEGKIVIAITDDEASYSLTKTGVLALKQIGAEKDLRNHFRWAHMVVGVKGASTGSALEYMNNTMVYAELNKRNIQIELGEKLTTELEQLEREKDISAIYLSGMSLDDSLRIFGRKLQH